MKKAEYVKRLKKMLTNKKEPCGYCPCSSHYNPRKLTPKGACGICQEFNGLVYIGLIDHTGRNFSAGCPCYRLSPDIAIKQAWRRIAEYEEKHGEIWFQPDLTPQG